MKNIDSITPNTPENKAAYRACYWGQPIAHYSDGDNNRYIVAVGKHDFSAIHYLELTQIFEISYEHAIEVAKIMFRDKLDGGFSMAVASPALFCINLKDKGRRYVSPKTLSIEAYQYLQSKGYLLPWRDLSIEELLTRGWAKVKEKQ